MDAVVSVISLSVLAVVGTLGVFSHAFDDTLLQRTGLALVVLASLGLLTDALEEPPAAMGQVLLYLGTALYAAATAWKMWRQRCRLRRRMRRI